jgi:hypothetical protein
MKWLRVKAVGRLSLPARCRPLNFVITFPAQLPKIDLLPGNELGLIAR